MSAPSPRVHLIIDHSSAAREAAALARVRSWSTSECDVPPLAQYAIIVSPVPYLSEVVQPPGTEPRAIGYGPPEQINYAFFLGATDYLCEPWTVLELGARVDHHLLRANNELGSVVTIRGTSMVLSAREQELWHVFRRHGSGVVDRHTLERVVGADATGGGAEAGRGARSRAVDVAVGRLRARLAGTGLTIVAVRGRGYRAVDSIAKKFQSGCG